MKRVHYFVLLLIGSVAFSIFLSRLFAADGTTFQTFEYGTIRWSGRENTHFIRPNGKVEMLGSLLSKIQRPERLDERTFYMNIAMNAVAKEGYEFAGMTPDEIVMRRPVAR